MRDPKRIESTLNLIKEVWEKYPDLRLMQLLTNVTGDGPFVYYIEDDDLVERVKELYKVEDINAKNDKVENNE